MYSLDSCTGMRQRLVHIHAMSVFSWGWLRTVMWIRVRIRTNRRFGIHMEYAGPDPDP